ncbi:MAG: hypothetical protein WCJ71_06740 [Candidatus Omnitrophota bacterium]
MNTKFVVLRKIGVLLEQQNWHKGPQDILEDDKKRTKKQDYKWVLGDTTKSIIVTTSL